MAQAGRAFLLSIDDFAGGTLVEIAGQTTSNLTINREMIDITTKSDAGVQKLMPVVGKFSIEVGVEGILSNSTLLDVALDPAPTDLGQASLVLGTLKTITGPFFLSNFASTGEDGPNAIGFTATLMSAGAITST